ncbi:MAG: DUF362 domain-containing protein [Candidatus Aminicenantales bacterium]
MSSNVYFIRASREDGDERLSEKALKVISRLEFVEKIEPDSFVALKIHFGEKGNNGYIKPDWLRGIISRIKSRTSRLFFTDTNTLYVGRRSNSVDHLNLAEEHGFSLENTGLPIIIADGLIGRNDDEVEINLSRVKSAKIASLFLDSDFLLCLSHLTGHVLTGLGGAMKNLGMGCASRAGKLEQHSVVHPWVNPKICTNCGICLEYCPEEAIFQREGSAVIDEQKCIGCGECLVVCKPGAVKMKWDEDYVRVQEKMAEYAYALHTALRGNIAYVNFLLKVTKDCDCMGKDEPPIVKDIGILASSDAVAVDRASVDLILETSGKDVLRKGYSIDWSVQLRHGEKIGLGTSGYRLVELK